MRVNILNEVLDVRQESEAIIYIVYWFAVRCVSRPLAPELIRKIFMSAWILKAFKSAEMQRGKKITFITFIYRK